MDNVLFYFAGLPVYVYGFLISIGLLFGTISALNEGRRRGISRNTMFDFILGSAIIFIIAGRIDVIVNYHGLAGLLRPWKIITELHMGINVGFGVFFAIVYGLISTVKNNTFGLNFLDAISPGLLLIGLFSNLGTTVFGKSTTVPWALQLGEFQLHPLPLYFALGYFMIYFIVKLVRRNIRFEGQIFSGALTLVIWLNWLILFFAESPNKLFFWIYPLFGLLGIAFWSFGYVNSPVPEKWHRGSLYWIYQAVVFGVSVFLITTFFYSL